MRTLTVLMIDRTRCVRPQELVGHSLRSKANLVGAVSTSPTTSVRGLNGLKGTSWGHTVAKRQLRMLDAHAAILCRMILQGMVLVTLTEWGV